MVPVCRSTLRHVISHDFCFQQVCLLTYSFHGRWATRIKYPQTIKEACAPFTMLKPEIFVGIDTLSPCLELHILSLYVDDPTWWKIRLITIYFPAHFLSGPRKNWTR